MRSSYGVVETLIRVLPTTSVPDVVNRLSRCNVGQCQSLSFTGIPNWKLGEFCSVIEAASHLAPEVVALDFSRMGLDELFLSFAIDLVDRCPNLKRLSFDNNYFTSKASTESLGKALKNKSKLSYLSLTQCHIDNEGATQLLKLIFSEASDKNRGNNKEISPGFVLHLNHNSLTTRPFVADVLSMISRPAQHTLNSVSLFGNFIDNHDASSIHAACAARRSLLERNGADSGRGEGQSVTTPRTALRLLVQCAEELDKGAFPTVLAMAKLLEEEGH